MNSNYNQGNYPPPQGQQPAYRDDVFSPGPYGKTRGIAALLAIFLGSLGIQYFYLGKTTAGIIAILISWCSCGVLQLLWLIQGILMFVMTQEEFDRKFVITTSTFPLF